MSTFGADIGRIWRSDLDTGSKAVLTAVRYFGDSAGVCSVPVAKVAHVASMHRATVIERMVALVARGWLEKVSNPGGESTYRVTSPEGVPVVHDDTHPSPTTTPTRRLRRHPPSSTTTPPVVHDDRSPLHPPNKEIQTSSRLLPDVAADAPVTATPDFLAVERAYLEATGGGLMVKSVEAVALKTLTDTHGPGTVITAIEEAVLANTRGRVSVNFVRAILEKRGQGGGASSLAPRRPNEFRNATPTEMRRLEGDDF